VIVELQGALPSTTDSDFRPDSYSIQDGPFRVVSNPSTVLSYRLPGGQLLRFC
jgi:hypothetical protein